MNETVFKKIRACLGLSQLEFAKSIGLEQGSYSGLESGKKGSLTKQTALLLNVVHNVNMDYLYERGGEMFVERKCPNVSIENLDTGVELKTLFDVIKRQNATIESLEREIARLRSKYETEKERSVV